LGSRDYPTALAYFSQNYGIALSGYVQWAQGNFVFHFSQNKRIKVVNLIYFKQSIL
jgi:hypothetical protein